MIKYGMDIFMETVVMDLSLVVLLVLIGTIIILLLPSCRKFLSIIEKVPSKRTIGKEDGIRNKVLSVLWDLCILMVMACMFFLLLWSIPNQTMDNWIQAFGSTISLTFVLKTAKFFWII